MSDASVSATHLTSQYLAQVTSDLEHNTKERERIGAEISALQEQLAALEHDFGVLQNVRQALEGATPDATDTTNTDAAEDTASAAESVVVPAPRRSAARKPRTGTGAGAAGKRTRAKSTKTPATKTTATKTPAGKAPAAKAAQTKAPVVKAAEAKAPAAKAAEAKAAGAARGGAKQKQAAAKKSTARTSPAAGGAPKLVELVRQHLTEQKEPRSAAEVAEALGQAHPQRSFKTTVVRTTLESLVARNHAQRTKQGSSVFYTASEASQEANGSQAAPAAQAPAASEGEQTAAQPES
ncbi:BlaI/MecI/CopY family transcriptional regulator [Streptomyces sp. NPDC057413]|uniref:BlaI/MecI/CopY family transcriptional regulator n=1 Tax=Streptomyces sp. NPDC057413 TaxID=3346124 RepID=UPI003680F2C0